MGIFEAIKMKGSFFLFYKKLNLKTKSKALKWVRRGGGVRNG